MVTLSVSDLCIIGHKSKTSIKHLLKSRWDEIHSTDVFRYKIDKIIERPSGPYVLLLNPERGTNRRTAECIDNVCQKFDDTKFNFTIVSPKEVLFTVHDEMNNDTHSILVNVSPISRYHSLLCPFVDKKLPQIVTRDSLVLVLQFIFNTNDLHFKIGFNSLCAFASVNHLHFHLFFISDVLAVETAEWKQLKGNLHCLREYIVPAFCFQIDQSNISEVADDISKLVQYLIEKSIAHNILISNKVLGTAEVYVYPRRSSSGMKQLEDFNVAVCELSGWFPVFCEKSFHKLNVEDLEHEVRKWSLDGFDQLCNDIIKLY